MRLPTQRLDPARSAASGAAMAQNLLAARAQRPSWRNVQQTLNASRSLRRPCQNGRDKRKRCSATVGLRNRTPRCPQQGTGVEKVDDVYARCRVVDLSRSAHRDERAAAYVDFAGWIGCDDFDPSRSPARPSNAPAPSLQSSQLHLGNGYQVNCSRSTDLITRAGSNVGQGATSGGEQRRAGSNVGAATRASESITGPCNRTQSNQNEARRQNAPCGVWVTERKRIHRQP